MERWDGNPTRGSPAYGWEGPVAPIGDLMILASVIWQNHEYLDVRGWAFSQCPAQCPETAEGAAARVVRRGCGARGPRWGQLSPQWPAQWPETAEGAAARVVAAGGPCVRFCALLRSRSEVHAFRVACENCKRLTHPLHFSSCYSPGGDMTT